MSLLIVLHADTQAGTSRSIPQHAKGKRGSWLSVLFNALWRFLRGYIFRLGFLDRWRGLVALIAAKYVREKHLRLVILDRAGREAARR